MPRTRKEARKGKITEGNAGKSSMELEDGPSTESNAKNGGLRSGPKKGKSMARQPKTPQKRHRQTETFGNNASEQSTSTTTPPREKRSRKEKAKDRSEQQTADEAASTSNRLIAYGYENPTTVEFNEDGEVIAMSVQPNENQTSQQNYDPGAEVDYEDDEDQPDNEVSFKNSQSTSRSEQSSSDEEDEGHLEGYYTDDDDSTPQESQQVSQMVTYEQPKRKTLTEIDREMKVKLQELHSLMAHSGMDESAREIARSLRTLEQGMHENVNGNSNKLSLKAQGQGQTGLIAPKALQVANPKPINRRKSGNESLHSESEETIYKDAVQKKNRNSSSSDEGVNTSDELINLQFNDLNVIDDGYIAGSGANKRRTTERS